MFATRFFISRLRPALAAMLLLSGVPGSAAATGFRTADRSLSPVSRGSMPQETDPQDTVSVLLKEISVSAGIKDVRTSPLRLQSIDQRQIASAAGKTYPELLRGIPGLFATAETGSYGDAKINIRGFQQENISVLLNGIPISGLSSGNMFWNNWLGLTDATASIQVQKGIGGSMLSDNSVGGTINIITRNPSARPAFNAGYSYTGYGTSKGFIGYNSGTLGRGWNVFLTASYTWGRSWVECTGLRSMSYLLSVSKQFNGRHSLLFTALGSPERHQQRSTRLTYDEIEQYGRAYSKNWGEYRGEAKTINQNKYFRPYFMLNHFYTASPRLSVSSAVYAAAGNGGGIWTESKGARIISYQREGHIDWNAVVEENRNRPDGDSQNILSDYLAGNIQLGAKSAVNLVLSPKWDVESGLHYQYYSTWEKEKITDLLGGQYWLEDYRNNSLAGEAGRNPVKHVGDYIRTHNGKLFHYGTLYGTVRYRDARWVLEGGISLNGTFQRRWDKYNYIADTRSAPARKAGTGIKAGALYKAAPGHSFYLNGAWYSRIPYTSVFFASGNNSLSRDVRNERNALGELGYRFAYNRGGLELTFYTAYWKNKTLLSASYKPLEEDAYKFMITGLNALHYGIEAQAHHRFSNRILLSAFFSAGSWKWKNNVDATLYDPYTDQAIGQIHVYSDGLPVGDAPQTQMGATLEVHPFRAPDPARLSDFALYLRWQHNTRYWADFDPASRTNPDDTVLPYRIPSWHLLDVELNWTLRLASGSLSSNPSGSVLNLFFNLNNLTDSFYIERGKDGLDHTRETFTGYWGIGRNFNFGLRLAF